MKKLFKTAMLAVAVVAAGYGGYKTYSTYTVKDGTLVSENIDALSQSGGDGGYMLPEVVVECSEGPHGRCYDRDDEITEVKGIRGYWCEFIGYQDLYCEGVIEV